MQPLCAVCGADVLFLLIYSTEGIYDAHAGGYQYALQECCVSVVDQPVLRLRIQSVK